MFSLPSFLSFPFSLPSLPTISLPDNIQRRFLSYVLKRALGRFVKAGGLDVERIQAQISEGWVEIEGLEVDTDEINSLIPEDLPLRLTSGSLSRVTAKVPFPNLWSDPLTLTLESLNFDLTLAPIPTTPATINNPQTPRPYKTPLSPSLDLANSVTSAADEFLHSELDAYEEAALESSIQQSIIFTQNNPFVKDDELPGAFPFPSPGTGMGSRVESTTVLAGLVERILARLEFSVRNVRVRVRVEDEKFGGVIELRIGEVRYIEETEGVDGPVKAVRVSGVEMSISPLPGAAPRPGTSRSSSMSTTSTVSDDDTGNGAMEMSMAVADLRESTVGLEESMASGASVYQSATSEGFGGASNNRQFLASPLQSKSKTPSIATIGAVEPPRDTILSFGTEDILLRIITIRPAVREAQGHVGDHAGSPNLTVHHPNTESLLPSLEVDLSVGTITTMLLPKHLATILVASQILTQSSSTPPASGKNVEDGSSAQSSVQAQLTLKGIHNTLIYDVQASENPEYLACLPRFWAKPISTQIPVGHLRLRLEGLEASYTSVGQVSKSGSVRQAPSRNPTSTNARRISSAKVGSKASAVKCTLRDASIFEYLASATTASDLDEESPPGGSFPVLLFDPGLIKQYETSTSSKGALVFPEYDAVDWRNSGLQRKSTGAAGEKAWRVRQKGRGVLKGVGKDVAEQEAPVLQMYKPLAGEMPATIDLQPIHAFVDLSLVERLLPMLKSISPAIRGASVQTGSPVIANAKLPSAPSGTMRVSYAVIDDLDAQATSHIQLNTSKPSSPMVIKCPMIRLDIRCPAPPNRRGSWGDGAHLRSGIVTLDIHGLSARIGTPPTPAQPPILRRKSSYGPPATTQISSQTIGQVEWQKVILFFCRVPEKRSTAFLIVGPLSPEPNEKIETLLLPSISLKTNSSSVSPHTTTVTCKIPSIQSTIHKSTIEGLQFFADDMTHWLDGAFGDGHSPPPRDELRMIGSRFFGGSKASSETESAVEDVDEGVGGAFVLRVVVSEIKVGLVLSEKRDLVVRFVDLDTKLEVGVKGGETGFVVSLVDGSVSDKLFGVSRRIFGRTTPSTLTLHNSPLLHLRFTSSVDPETSTKESDIKVNLSSATMYITKDFTWIDDLLAFVKTPEGVFEDVEPTLMTRIGVLVDDCSICVEAPSCGGGLVVNFGSGEVKTEVISGAEEGIWEFGFGSVGVLVVDDLKGVGEMPGGFGKSEEAWKKVGYAPLGEVRSLDAVLCMDLTGTGEVSLNITQCQARLTACADSLVVLENVIGDMANLVPGKPELAKPKRQPVSLDKSINVFASIDDEAFNRLPDVISGADLIEDDLPTNLDYLDQTTKTPSVGESLRSWQSTGEGFDHGEKVPGEMNGETIKILYDGYLDMNEGYWDELPVLGNGPLDTTRVGKTRIRLLDASISINLYDGYDYPRTRKIIEDEIRAVRRRLEKIRQLLASGQKADSSLESETTSMLFNSIYIGIEPHRLEGGNGLLAAIDEELDGLGDGDDEVQSQSSWQTDFLVGMERTGVKGKSGSGSTRLRGRRLTRSKKPQIEIVMSGVKGELDVFGEEEGVGEMASRVEVMLGNLEILDHIKSSSWKKFLMEMKVGGRGNVRETDAVMLRGELVGVRPMVGADVEMRLRLKVLPLRLHIDQDALDFLKRFFAFTAPTVSGDAAPLNKKPSVEPFFQHVEIFPVELKLDYKPKRVDFAALREGKTIELMNFFHFDGAEMSLRHITLSGVTGWSRLSTTLQDLWTPDVKANQLADVISGVSPIRSLVNVGSGVADLILLPIEQYRKDGRISRGVQRGTSSFVKSTALEMMKLGARLATGTQVILEKAEGVLGGKAAESRNGLMESGDDEGEEGEVISRFANQPGDVREGVKAGYKSLSRNVTSAAQTILAVPMEVYERSGDNGPLKAVVRAVPIAVLKPMIGASEAVSKTLLGMRNSLDPQGKEELEDKYK